MEKILIVYLHGIGDHLLATPAIHAYKKAHPDHEITLMTLCHQTYRDLWQANKGVDRILFSTLSRNPRYGHPLFWLTDYWTIRRDIRKAQREHHFSRVYFIVHYFLPASLYSFLPFKKYRTHKSFLIAKQLGVSLHHCEYFFTLPRQYRAWASSYLQNKSNRLVGVHFTGSSRNKSLPYDDGKRVLDLLTSKGYTVLVFNDKASYEREKYHYDGKNVINFVSSDILQTGALIDHCDFFIGVDSGIAHLAGALRKKVFCIYSRKIWSLNSGVLGERAIRFVFNKKTLIRQITSFMNAKIS